MHAEVFAILSAQHHAQHCHISMQTYIVTG